MSKINAISGCVMFQHDNCESESHCNKHCPRTVKDQFLKILQERDQHCEIIPSKILSVSSELYWSHSSQYCHKSNCYNVTLSTMTSQVTLILECNKWDLQWPGLSPLSLTNHNQHLALKMLALKIMTQSWQLECQFHQNCINLEFYYE